MQRSSRTLAIIALGCVAFYTILALDLVPSLRGDFGWRWPYESPDLPRLIPLVLTTVVYCAGAIGLRRRIVLWSLAGAIVIPLAALYSLDDPLYLLTVRTLSVARPVRTWPAPHWTACAWPFATGLA